MAASFRLARVLRLQAQIRRLSQHQADELAEELGAIEKEKAALARARAQLCDQEERAGQAGPAPPEAWWSRRVYDEALAFMQRRAAARAAEKHAALEAKRTELTRERREERKLLRLEEAHRRRAIEEEDRASERLLDELAVQAHRRTRKGD